MSEYLHPGVYVEEVPSGIRPVEGVATSITAIVGDAPEGRINEAVFVVSFDQYKNEFGDIKNEEDAMGFAVDAFFKNGGKNACIVRVGKVGVKTSTPDLNDYISVIDNILEKIREIGILLFPGKVWDKGDGKDIISHAISRAEKMKSRMVIIDADKSTVLTSENDAKNLSLPHSSYGAFYYPWLEVTNPFYKKGGLKTVEIAPSAVAAGIWAKIDADRGVWKAPAGKYASISGVEKLKDNINTSQQDSLNIWGVNCLRLIPNFGQVIWGSRTVATVTQSEWRYIPVRRTAIYLEESIARGIQWAVFEPNDSRLWSSLKTNIGNFMDTLFREGAFQGAKASDAYFVRCGLGDTMTQADIDSGRVIVNVGFAPLKPAEFVIVRIECFVKG